MANDASQDDIDGRVGRRSKGNLEVVQRGAHVFRSAIKENRRLLNALELEFPSDSRPPLFGVEEEQHTKKNFGSGPDDFPSCRQLGGRAG